MSTNVLARFGRFVCAKDFRFNGVPYRAGDAFDTRHMAISERKVQQLLNTRFIVLDEVSTESEETESEETESEETESEGGQDEQFEREFAELLENEQREKASEGE